MKKDGYTKTRKGNPLNPNYNPRLHFFDSQIEFDSRMEWSAYR